MSFLEPDHMAVLRYPTLETFRTPGLTEYLGRWTSRRSEAGRQHCYPSVHLGIDDVIHRGRSQGIKCTERDSSCIPPNLSNQSKLVLSFPRLSHGCAIRPLR